MKDEANISIPKSLWDELREEARRRNITAEEIITEAIKKNIERNGKHHAKR